MQWLEELPGQFEGVIVGNEVLDAMPVRAVRAPEQAAGTSAGVALADGKFTFEDRPREPNEAPSADALRTLPGDHDIVTETHAEAEGFTRAVGAMLTRGAAFFIDYGFPAAEYYHPQRAERHADVPLPPSLAPRPVPVSGAAGHHRARQFQRHRRKRRWTRA